MLSKNLFMHLIIYSEQLKRAELVQHISYQTSIHDLQLEIEKLFAVPPKQQELNIFKDMCGETRRISYIKASEPDMTIADWWTLLRPNRLNVAVIDLSTVVFKQHTLVSRGLVYNEFINLLSLAIGSQQQFPLELCMQVASFLYGAVESTVCIKYEDRVFGVEHETMGHKVYAYFGIDDKHKLINRHNFKKLRRNLCVGEQEIFMKSSRETMGGVIHVLRISEYMSKKYDGDDDFKRYDVINKCMLQLIQQGRNALTNNNESPCIQLFVQTRNGKTMTIPQVNVHDYVIEFKKRIY